MTVRHRWKGDELRRNIVADLKSALLQSGIIMQQEIKLQLNKGGPGPPSPPGQPPHKQTGQLGQSIQIDSSDIDDLTVRVGPDIRRVPYARIQEFGGRIVPRVAKLLAVPVNARARKLTRGRRSVRDIPNLKFIARRGKPPLLAFIENGRMKPMFVLLQSVTLPERPYIRPAVKLARPRIMKLLTDTIRNLGR